MHEEGKFGSLAQRLPDEVHGFKLAEICERRSAKTLADLLPRFHWVRYLDLGSCAFDLTDDDRTLRLLREALGHLTLLERYPIRVCQYFLCTHWSHRLWDSYKTNRIAFLTFCFRDSVTQQQKHSKLRHTLVSSN